MHCNNRTPVHYRTSAPVNLQLYALVSEVQLASSSEQIMIKDIVFGKMAGKTSNCGSPVHA